MGLISVHKQSFEVDADALVDKDAFERFAEEVAREVRETVEQRTLAGSYLPGSSPGHETYSEAYAESRGKPLSPVTLRDTGSMIAALQTKHQPRGVLRYFAGVEISDPRAARLAAIHNDTGAGRSKVVRRWFDLTDDEVRTIVQRAADNTKDFTLDVN